MAITSGSLPERLGKEIAQTPLHHMTGRYGCP